MEHVIDFSPNGAIEAMYNDQFRLSFLGPERITRASDIRWNEDRSEWDICIAVGPAFVEGDGPYAGFASYEEARAFEVLVLNECRKAQVDPLSQEGYSIALALRT